MVINYLKSSFPAHNTAIIYVFFDYKDEKNQSVSAILANLLRQLLEHLQHIPQEVQSFYGSRFVDPNQNNSTIEQWIALIELLCKKFCRSFLIVDALDECPELDENSNEARAKMFSSILRLSKSAHVFLTSRPSVDVAAEIPGCMTLSIRARYSDLRSYLKARKTEHTALKKIIDQLVP